MNGHQPTSMLFDFEQGAINAARAVFPGKYIYLVLSSYLMVSYHHNFH